MKPYGRKPAPRFPRKEDCHLHNGWRNWWEDMCSTLSRSGVKRLWRKEVDNELNSKAEEMVCFDKSERQKKV